MDRPRVVSVISKVVEERLPPDEEGVQVLESYVPAEGNASQAAGTKPQAPQQQAAPSQYPQAMQQEKPASGVFGSLFSRIRSLFGR